VIAASSLPAALHYLRGEGMVHVWNADLDRSRHGYVFYFTVLMAGGRFAEQIKVCENAHGRVTGATDLSAGEPDCATSDT
jgi:hypothetical protein